MRKSKLFVCLFACLQLLAQPVLACPSFPEFISLEGATFSELNISVRKAGGFSLKIANPSDSTQGESFSTNEGVICRREGTECVAAGSRVYTNSAGKVIGRLEACAGGFCLFSVKKNGEKDINAPYLKFTSLQREGSMYGSARIEAFDRTRQIGQMEVFGSPLMRSLAPSARGTLELRGNAISSSGSGCGGGGVSVVPFGSSGGAAAGAATSSSN